MTRRIAPALAVAAATICFASVAKAETELERGFAGALRGCEEWVLNPMSWAKGPAPFLAKVGLGDTIGLVQRVDEAALPPEALRRGNHYWRINSTPEAGFILVVSDQLPMCHITGGGRADLQPAIASVLESSAFAGRWERVEERVAGDMISSRYRSRSAPRFAITISRAKAPGQRLDRVQVLATGAFEPSK